MPWYIIIKKDGYDHIKKHPWFSNLNWVKLMEKDIKVPEIS